MEQALQITAACVLASLLAATIRKGAPETASLLILAAAVLAAAALREGLFELLSFFTELAARAGISEALLRPLYKTVGIALVVKLGAGLCKDAGASALSSAVELAGAVCALLAALPLMRRAMDVLQELMR